MEDTKRYVCKLATNGHQPGDEVFLTDAEVANANGGEAEPRYVLAEDQTAPVAPAHENVESLTNSDGDTLNVDENGVPEGMVEAIADQAFLDANPEVAARGVKVGDTIFVPKAPQA